eukprot:1754173-Pleurochrysis_carterae.AAC.2
MEAPTASVSMATLHAPRSLRARGAGRAYRARKEAEERLKETEGKCKERAYTSLFLSAPAGRKCAQ